MAQSTSSRVKRKIYGMGRGWAFSVIDFSTFGSRSAIDVTLHRLLKKETIRRVVRGVYDYPRHSKMLGGELSPDIDQVAQALARKFGWRVQPSGPAALVPILYPLLPTLYPLQLPCSLAPRPYPLSPIP